MVRALLAGEILLAVAPARAEGPTRAVPAMTLAEAQRYARARHPAVRAARARLAAARANTAIPRAYWLPTATAAAEIIEGTTNNTTASYLGVPGIALPRIGATPVTNSGHWAPHASTLVAVGVNQELFDFGRIATLSALEDMLAQAEGYQADTDLLAVEFGVAEAYFAVSAAHEVLKASEQAYERARVDRDSARARVNAGLGPPIDLTRADADLARYEVARIRAQGGVDVARSAFAAAVGIPGPALDLRGQTPPVRPLPPLSTAMETALRRYPELAARMARREAARATTRAIAAEARPNLALSATISGREGGAAPSSGPSPRFHGWVPHVPNWNVGVALVWPFFDGVRHARRRAAEKREQTAEAEIDLTRDQLQAQVEQAYTQARVTEAALVALEQGVVAAQANYAQALARFNAGLGNIVELADAEAVRTQAEIELAVGRFNLARARALLDRYMGGSQ